MKLHDLDTSHYDSTAPVVFMKGYKQRNCFLYIYWSDWKKKKFSCFCLFDQYVGWWNLKQTKGVSVLKHTHSLNLSFPYTVTWHLFLQMEMVHFLAPDLSYFSMYLMTFLLYSIFTLWPLFSMMSVYCLCAMDWRFKTFVVLQYLKSA